MTATGFQIKDVAERSGFSAATLRYYEDIGLLAPAERTASGYRVYDEAAIERLAFIGRAKQLGCSLDEIADLNTSWDGGECGPVQDRLRSLVNDKIGLARRQVAELLTLTAELERAAAALGGHRPVGPCDAECGCLSATTVDAMEPPAPVGPLATSRNSSRHKVTLTVKPTSRPNEVPIACTLGPGNRQTRLDEWQTLLVHVRDRVAIVGGVRLVYEATVPVAELVRLSTAEQDCCQFFSFAITIDNRGIALEVCAPDDATAVLHALFGGTL